MTSAALAITLAGCAPAVTGSGGSSGSVTGGGTSSGGSAGATSKEIDACSLLSASDASTLVGETLKTGVSSTIASGQDQCKYRSGAADIGLNVIVYQPTSGVAWDSLVSATSATQSVTGVGDKAATDGAIELDVQDGTRIIAVQDENADARIAVAKAIVAALK